MAIYLTAVKAFNKKKFHINLIVVPQKVWETQKLVVTDSHHLETMTVSAMTKFTVKFIQDYNFYVKLIFQTLLYLTMKEKQSPDCHI